MIDPKHIQAIRALIDHCYNNVPYFGLGDTTRLGQDATEALEALASLQSQIGDGVMVQIGLEGGLVGGGTANVPMKIVVFDYDTGMGDDEELSKVPQDGDSDVNAYVTRHVADVSPKHIERVKAFMGKA